MIADAQFDLSFDYAVNLSIFFMKRKKKEKRKANKQKNVNHKFSGYTSSAKVVHFFVSFLSMYNITIL